jgi:hypothetical protein
MGSDDGAKPNHVQEGLPTVAKSPNYALPIGSTCVIGLLGLGIAYATFTYGATDKYENRIKDVQKSEQHYAFAAAAILGATIRLVNMYPAVHKGMIMLQNSGNLRSNPFIYKAIGTGASNKHIVFDDAGEVGKYNRANRSLHHMIENFGVVLAGLALAGAPPHRKSAPAASFSHPTTRHPRSHGVPVPRLRLDVRLLRRPRAPSGRIHHRRAPCISEPRRRTRRPRSNAPAPRAGYGGHAIGFVLSTLASAAIEGMLGLVAIKSFGFA